MIAVVAVTGEDMTGGVSAGGEHDAQRELLPVEKGMKSTGDSAVFVHCVFPQRTAGAVAWMTVSVMHRGTGCLKPAANSFEFRSMNLALNPCNEERTSFVVLCRHAGACALMALFLLSKRLALHSQFRCAKEIIFVSLL